MYLCRERYVIPLAHIRSRRSLEWFDFKFDCMYVSPVLVQSYQRATAQQMKPHLKDLKCNATCYKFLMTHLILGLINKLCLFTSLDKRSLVDFVKFHIDISVNQVHKPVLENRIILSVFLGFYVDHNIK